MRDGNEEQQKGERGGKKLDRGDTTEMDEQDEIAVDDHLQLAGIEDFA